MTDKELLDGPQAASRRARRHARACHQVSEKAAAARNALVRCYEALKEAKR